MYVVALIVGVSIGFALCSVLTISKISDLQEVEMKYRQIVRYARDNCCTVDPSLLKEEY